MRNHCRRIEHTLTDWDSGAPFNVSVELHPDGIGITDSSTDCPDGRAVHAVVQDGVLRALCFDGTHDAPLGINIHPDYIEISETTPWSDQEKIQWFRRWASANGYAVSVFTPEELRNAEAKRVEEAMIERGWVAIEALAEDAEDMA